jgi:16S rRNA (uracil1498-N3)-methyltransferase
VSAPRRLHVERLFEGGGETRLGEGATRHARVLRLEAGDEVVLFDGRGAEASGRVISVDEDGVLCVVGAPSRAPDRGPRVVLCQCLPKGGKLEDIVRASTELGVAAIELVTSERSVPRLEAGRAERRLERLARVAQEAARQSGRATVPALAGPATLEEALGRAPADAVKLALAPSALLSLSDALSRAPMRDAASAASAWVLVGPEGGLAPEELRLAGARGFVLVGLGPTVLRVETAAPVAVALVTHALGGLRPESSDERA